MRFRIAKLAKQWDPARISPPQPPAFRGNRFARRAQKDPERERRALRNFSRFMKSTAIVALVSFVYSGVIAPLAPGSALSAQPVFRDFDETQNDVERYRDRANRLDDADAWTNYMELGIASEFVQWEEDAYESLRDEFEAIDGNESLDDDQKEFEKDLARAQLEAAALVWEQEAEDYLYEQRGAFRASGDDIEASVDQIGDDVFAAVIADVEAQFAGQTDIDLAAWDAAMDAAMAPHGGAFDTQLTGELDAVRAANAGLSGAELTAFRDELERVEREILTEFEFRDNFYILRARNDYVAERRADDLSARLFAEQNSADAVGEEIMAATEADLAGIDDQLDAAQAETQSALDGPGSAEIIDDIAGDWQTKMEVVITAGLDRWDRAEEDLYRRRLAWLESSNRSREEGEAIWEAQHEKLKARRTEWLGETEEQIREGREAWEAKFAEFAQSRTEAEDELARFITEERERRDATLGQIGDMVLGGGAALAEAKDAYRYFAELAELSAQPGAGTHRNDADLLDFYIDQRDIHDTAITSFTTMLTGVEGVLTDNMHGDGNFTGLLNDRRAYAGDLAATVAGLSDANFQSELGDLMNARGEDFVLYRRDMESLIERNALFTERAADLNDTAVFDADAAGDLDALLETIDGLDSKYDEHRRELREIYFRTRTAVNDADRLTQIKADIAAYLPGTTDREARLKTVVTNYFNEGLAGYYLTDNENDPYLMTDAEYEWELLRRERNYLAKRFERAEAVKRYADLANRFGSGLEMAQVTQERADVAELRSDIRETAYYVLKGDRSFDPAFAAEARALLDAREPALNAEAALLAGYDPGNRAGNAGEVDAHVAAIDAHLAAYVPDESARETHRLKILRDKLIYYRAQMDQGAAASELDQRWTVLAGGANALGGEVTALVQEFDFTGLRAEIDALEAQAGDETIPEMLDRVYVEKEEVRLAGVTLAAAKTRLDAARDVYRQAYLDFKVLNDPNAKEIIANELLSTTNALSEVLHHMQEIETIPGFDSRLYDPTTKKRIEYLYGVQQRAQAQDSIAFTDALSDAVLGLDASKLRLQNLEAALASESADANLDGQSARDIANFFISGELQFTDSVSASESFRSQPAVLSALATLKSLSSELTVLESDLSQAIADGDPAAEIEILRARVSQNEEGIRRKAEEMIAGIRGEERARRDATLRMLDFRDGGDNPLHDLADLRENLQSDLESAADDLQSLGESAAATIETYLNANRDQDFATLLAGLNAQIAGLTRNLSPGDGYAQIAAPPAALADYARYDIARRWLLDNRAAIDRANAAPDEYDRRTRAEKWDALLAAVDDQAEDAAYQAAFQAALPNDAGDAWVLNFRTHRTALAGRVAAVLSAPDVSLAYSALDEADRRILNSYGMNAAVSGGAADLRRALEFTEEQLENDLAALNENFQTIFLREREIEIGNDLSDMQRDYALAANRYAADQGERNILSDDRDALDAEIAALAPVGDPVLEARRDQIDARLAILDARLAADRPALENLEDQVRLRQRELGEIRAPGSSNGLTAYASASTGVARTTLGMREWGLRLLENVDRDPVTRPDQNAAGVDAATPVEVLKAAIGMFETDRQGEIVRDSSGAPQLTQEFIDLGISDPAVDLGQVFAGDLRASQLEAMAERLLAYRDDGRALSPEVSAAVALIESDLYQLIAARRMIDERFATGDAIVAASEASIAEAQAIQNKLSQIAGLEAAIQDALTNARAQGFDEGQAVLAVLEERGNAELLYLFDGYNVDPATGALSVDTVVHAAGSERLGDLRRLADRFRVSQEEQRLAEIVGAYADAGLEFLIRLETNPGTLPLDQADFLAAYAAEVDGSDVIAQINAISETDFRTQLWSYVDGMAPGKSLFKSEIAGVLRANPGDEAGLKAAVLAALNGLQTRIDDTLTIELGRSDAIIDRDRDLEVESSVAALITQYATRGTDARAALLPGVAAVNDADSVADAKTALSALIAGLSAPVAGATAAFAGIKRELTRLVDESAAADAASLKAELTDALNALEDPAAADTLTIEGELYLREMKIAQGVSDNVDSYEADDYPEELREFVLVRAHTLAKERYADYLALKNSGLAEERAAASLNLTGLMGDFARNLLLRDFADYRGANDYTAKIAAARAGDEGPYSIGQYLSEYLDSANSDGSLLPRGGADLVEDLALREYQRIAAAQTAAGGGTAGLASLDESEYFADYRAYLLLAKIEDHLGAGYDHAASGASEADRRTAFTAAFENFLDDATYAIGGESVRDRLLNSAQIDALFQTAFARYEEGADLDQYIPAALDTRRFENRLADAPTDPADLVPAELLAIAGYDSLDYRQLAYAADAQYGKALAQFEAARQLEADTLSGRVELSGVGLNFSDVELDQIIDRAGHSALSAGDRSLVRTMLRVRATEMYTSATGGEALTILRNDRAFRSHYGDAAAERSYELFAAENARAIGGVEAKFFAALNAPETDDRLLESAQRERGDLLRAVIERSRGATTAYYSGESAEIQTAIDSLSAVLFASGAADERFSSEEQAALLARAADFETHANYQADRELISSGVFEELEGQLRAAVNRSPDASLREYVSANPNSALRAYAEQLYVSAGSQGGLSAPAATAMAGHPALAAAIDQAIEGMQPRYREVMLAEQSIISRFLEEFLESDQERRHIRDMLRDPSLSHPDQGLALHHDSAKTLALTTARKQGSVDALLRSIEEHGRYFANLAEEQSREIAVSREVKGFGELKGNETNFEDSRFAQYRTYAGTEREHQAEEWQRYSDAGGTDSFEQWSKGRFLEVEDMGIADVEALLNGDYDAVLTSDDEAALISQRVENGTDTATTTDDETVDVRKVRTVGQINTMTFASSAEEMRYTYFANLANNYMEAATQLNASLNSVWTAGALADAREAASGANDVRAAVKASYDPQAAGPAAAGELDILISEKTAATAQLANYGETQLGQAQNEISQLKQGYAQASQEYADAARRKQLDGIKLIEYAQSTFTDALNELEGANIEMEAAEIASNTERNQYDTLMSQYTDQLNELSGYFRSWQAAESEKEKRLAVLDYANTPYLETGETEEASGAQNQYDAALAAMENANDRLQDAAFNVQTEDRIDDFAAIVTGLEAGDTYAPLDASEQGELAELRDRKFREYEPLDAAEETRLTELMHREMHERYGDLIVARAEHIKHTMRMVRVEKAAAIIKSEIEEKRLIAADKERQFEDALTNNFGAAVPTQAGMTQERAEQARMAVYQRLVNKIESGQTLYDEFRGWYYGSGSWMPQYGGVVSSAVINGGNLNPIGAAASFELATGGAQTLGMNAADAENFAIWQSNGGQLSEYTQFQASYFGYLMSLMQLDSATISLGITLASMTPLIGLGYAIVSSGAVLMAQGMTMLATVVGATEGLRLIQQGVTQMTIGYSQVTLATTMIASATLTQMFAGLNSVFAGTAAYNAAGNGSVNEVRKKEQEYEQAQSELDYLTKVPDLDTLKDRYKQYGANNDDPEDDTYDLYNLSDEDLIYLLEMVGGTENFAGATLTAEQRSEALDITGKQNTVEYRDSAGRRYDPTTGTATQPAPLENGSYGGYTRVLVQGHDRADKSYQYFQIIDETADSQIAYDMGEVLDSMLNHGNTLREDRKNEYISAGNAAATTDSTFVYRERDATYQQLFEDATNRTDGGREFAGYRTTFTDYAGNQNEVFEQELQQRVQVQTAEWNLREQELNDRYADWEARMNTILSKGQSNWGNSENLFLQERREWERKMAEDRADAEGIWATRVAEHGNRKADWEADIRNQITEGNVEETLTTAVDDMNAQITTMNANMGTNLETQDRNALIAQAIDEIRRDEPSEAEKLKKLNESIEKFNTNVSISQLSGTNLGKGLGKITGEYRETMRKQRHDMQVYANAKIFEQYQLLVDDLLEQIRAQNRATEARTTADAAAEGFLKQGAIFVKTDSNGKSFAVVNEFVGFDGETAIQEEQARAGAMHGLRGTGAEPSAFDNSAIVKFLESADSIQVASFFDYQRKAFQVVSERIMGSGTGEERQATFQPNETVHGRLGVWIGRPADQQVAQGLIEAAAGSYHDDQEGLRHVARSATGYGELGASTVRPSQLGVGFYTQLWYYGQQMDRRQAETIDSVFQGGLLETGVAKYYNTYNPFVSIATTYNHFKNQRELHGAKSGALWAGEGAKILKGVGASAGGAVGLVAGGIKVRDNGNVDYKLTTRDAVGAIPILGGFVAAGMDFDEDGNQRRGGLRWNPRAMGAATADLMKMVPVYGALPAEYIKRQTVREHSSYDQDGRGDTVGQWVVNVWNGALGALALQRAMEDAEKSEAAEGEASKGETRAAEAEAAEAHAADQANRANQQHQAADVARGAGYVNRRGAAAQRFGAHLRNQFVGGVTLGLNNGKAGFGSYLMNAAFGVGAERVGNFFSADHNGNRWNWETTEQRRGRAGEALFDALKGQNAERSQVLIDYLFPGKDVTYEGIIAAQQQDTPAITGQTAGKMIQAILQHNGMRITPEMSERIFSDTNTEASLAGGVSMNSLLEMAEGQLGRAPDLPGDDELKQLVGDEDRRMLSLTSGSAQDDFDYTYRYAKLGAASQRIRSLRAKYRTARNSHVAKTMEPRIRAEVDQQFGAGTYDAALKQTGEGKDAYSVAGGWLNSTAMAAEKYLNNEGSPLKSLLGAVGTLSGAAGVASPFAFASQAGESAVQNAYAAHEVARDALSPEAFAAYNIEQNRQVALVRAGINYAEFVGSTAGTIATGPVFGMAGTMLRASRAGMLLARSGQMFGAAAGRAATAASVYSSYGVRVGSRIAQATAREIPQIVRVAGQQAARSSQYYSRLAAGAARQYATAGINAARFAGQNAMGGARYYGSALANMPYAAQHLSGAIGGTLNASLNLARNEEANFGNTATAFLSGYAVGFAGSRIAGLKRFSSADKFLLGAGLGLASDFSAQSAERVLGLTTTNRYDYTRLTLGAAGGSLSTGIPAVLGSGAGVGYIEFALGKWPSVFSSLVNDRVLFGARQ
ncbi:MAG: hypothetical protein NXI24_10860 [bacterium]|nr:hypothetical protein [bacterium]